MLKLLIEAPFQFQNPFSSQQRVLKDLKKSTSYDIILELVIE